MGLEDGSVPQARRTKHPAEERAPEAASKACQAIRQSGLRSTEEEYFFKLVAINNEAYQPGTSEQTDLFP